MSWHYQVLRQVEMDGKYGYGIAEVYTDPVGHTGFVEPYGKSRKEVIHVLEMMLRDAKQYKTKTNKGNR